MISPHPDLQVARLVRDIGGGPVLGRSNVYTWRTKEYMLSSVQDYHGGMTAGQQHSWQLSLDPGRGRTVFTTQPTDHSYKHDQYWVGGVLPRLGQVRNTLIAIYNPALLVEIVFNTTITHAHFYREGYEEVVEGGGWVMARQGETFVALYSQQDMTWTDNTQYLDRELVAEGSQNVWICHVGDSASYSDFSAFTQTVLQSRVEVERQAEDGLVQCLRSEKCLAGNVLRTVECLSPAGDCSLQRYPHSSLGQCLVKQGSHGEFHHLVSSLDPAGQRLTDVRKLSRYLDCLRTSQTEISVRFSISDSRLSLDWSGEMTYQVSEISSPDIRSQQRHCRVRGTPSLAWSAGTSSGGTRTSSPAPSGAARTSGYRQPTPASTLTWRTSPSTKHTNVQIYN